MAVNCSSAQISIKKYGSFLKHANKDLMPKQSYVPQKKGQQVGGALPLRITASSIKNKVYEDESQGIICYQDENGEIICEGYDEGPRYQHPFRPTCHPRDVEIMNLFLRQSGIQIVKGEEINLNHGEVEGVISLKEDLNLNGFS
ncbi:hypothetical protein HN51_021251 [Arachis hypogaea]|uniref:Uncharacterized protein n=1 Tax=Arachis hypogaea TaxID=3818 RepID=A0A445EHD1_ARAHY|nr:uncharacterized protein LOC112735242 [Arachis hypogaea]QHO52301.1 uncharacterized protein DS421_2g38190 [Arachis hypogaea]RYR74849.1 hypothetical protein Ahy_A02g009559 [Arachis hypogaea]